jgi:hypothetical protein
VQKCKVRVGTCGDVTKGAGKCRETSKLMLGVVLLRTFVR